MMNKIDHAYCGDAILRLCLREIYHAVTRRRVLKGVHMLQENRILAVIVSKNPEIFGEDELDASKKSSKDLGTTYEAKLYDVYKEFGIEECKQFIMRTFEIKDITISPHTIYNNFMHYRANYLRNKKMREYEKQQEIGVVKYKNGKFSYYGNTNWLTDMDESEKIKLISDAMEWAAKNEWQPLQHKNELVWIDCKQHTYLINGSDYHYDELVKVGLSTPELISLYLKENAK